jgi:hypothetical protein
MRAGEKLFRKSGSKALEDERGNEDSRTLHVWDGRQL